MNHDDDDDRPLTISDVESIRSAARKMRRLGLGATIATSWVGAGFMYLLVLRQGSASAAQLVAAIFLGLGVWVFVEWWRRYRRILGEIEQVEMRIRAGEKLAPSSLGGK